MLKYCIKTYLGHKWDFDWSIKNVILKFLICMFKANKYQSFE